MVWSRDAPSSRSSLEEENGTPGPLPLAVERMAAGTGGRDGTQERRRGRSGEQFCRGQEDARNFPSPYPFVQGGLGQKIRPVYSRQAMDNISKKEFAELALDGRNYLTWAMDVKINLSSRNLISTITTPAEGAPAIPEPAKYAALHFIRHHLYPSLKDEYMMEENSLSLWDSLKERYDQQRSVMLPKAQRQWALIRFQDFKSVAAYNSAVHQINSKLRFCNSAVLGADLIEKTLSTFHPDMRLIAEQHRNQKYRKISELIYALLQAEKPNEILDKNNLSRPTGTLPLPEAHFNSYSAQNFRVQRRTRERKREIPATVRRLSIAVTSFLSPERCARRFSAAPTRT
uniref:Uncharacterized protein n=1 Tax=Avena sativa TaxID=4498 RepID=A0ACD5XNR6_AVESA